MSSNLETIIVLDFGSQYTQLIGRRIREASVYSEILPFNTSLDAIRAHQPRGIILSGGPDSVYEAGAPACDPRVFDLGIPIWNELRTNLMAATMRRTPSTNDKKAAVRPSSLPGKKLRIALTSCLSSCGSLGISNFKASVDTLPHPDSALFNRNGSERVSKELGPEMKSTGEAIRFIKDLRDPYFRQLYKDRSMYLSK